MIVVDGAGGGLVRFDYSYDDSYNRIMDLKSSQGLNIRYTYDNNRNIIAKNGNGAAYQFNYHFQLLIKLLILVYTLNRMNLRLMMKNEMLRAQILLRNRFFVRDPTKTKQMEYTYEKNRRNPEIFRRM